MKTSIIADPRTALNQARQLVATDPALAVKQARQMLKDHPRHPAVLRLLGAGLRKLGKADEAAAAEREAVQLSTANPAHREAARAVAAGDKLRAIKILESILARDSEDVVALVMLGLQFSVDGELDVAGSLLRKAVATAPSDVAARTALAEHLQRTKYQSEALATLDQLDAEAAQAPNVLSLKASILRDLGRQEEEVAILEDLAATQPHPQGFRLRLGHAYRMLGDMDKAVAAYRAVLAEVPYEGTSWWSLANLKVYKFSDEDIAQMENWLAKITDSPRNRIRLSFALGKAYEDRKQAEPSFRHYAEGNRLRNEIAKYNPEKITEWVDQVEANQTADFLSSRSAVACHAPDPIFVVGMQRSGSTLVEQILDSHPLIEGTAELPDFPALVREQGEIAHRRGITVSERLRTMSDQELKAFGEAYIERTRVFRTSDKSFFTDKMPVNWLYVGLIRYFLPNAKIIDVRRHPMDCCFSNWKQLYGSGLEHTYSMENMGRYYSDYVRLLRHVDQAQPGKIHRVIYERVIDDLEGEVRRLLDYLGLPFDEACLNFHSNERLVRTISAQQVREPINRRGLDQWKPYEHWLGPLKQALGSTLDDWDK